MTRNDQEYRPYRKNEAREGVVPGMLILAALASVPLALAVESGALPTPPLVRWSATLAGYVFEPLARFFL